MNSGFPKRRKLNVVDDTLLEVRNIHDLFYKILSDDKLFYSRDELLRVIEHLEEICIPKFIGNCDYIS